MERWIAIGSLILGSLAFGVVLSIPKTPDVPLGNRAGGLMPAVRIADVPAPTSDATGAAKAAPLIELPAVEVIASTTRAQDSRPTPAPSRTRAVAASPVERAASQPCSPWREIGPTHVNDGVPAGSHRVRELC